MSADSEPTPKKFKPDDETDIFKFSDVSIETIRKSQEEFANQRNWNIFHTPRNLLIAMVGEVGELAELFQWRGEVKEKLPDWKEDEKNHLGEELSDVLLYLIRLSDKCEIDLPAASLEKIKKNGKKYPAKNGSGKKTSSDNEPTTTIDSKSINEKESFTFSDTSIEKLRKAQEEFAAQRNWERLHTPRNLVLSTVAEVGELAELFQWRGEVKERLPDWTENEKEHLGEELSDVLLNLIRLSDVCRIDLPVACLQKITKNGMKYPARLVSGSSKKYTEYKELNGKLVTSLLRDKEC